MITVGELKEKLQNVIDVLEDYNNWQEVELVSNTYFLGHSRMFLGLSGYNGGYVDLCNIEDAIQRDEDEE